MPWVPADSSAVSKVAVLPLPNCTVPRFVDPSRKTTAPLNGFGAFAFCPGDVTFTVNRTVWLAVAVVGVAVSVVVVGNTMGIISCWSVNDAAP